MYYIGIDLGISSTKLLLVDETGDILKEVSKTYDSHFPHPGWSEQDLADWWNACVEGIPELLRGYDAGLVAGIGAGGQMHGLVVLDDNDQVIRPAILWNDARTAKQVEYLNHTVGQETLRERTGNIAFAGFTAPKLLWMSAEEPENFQQIKKIMLPKDYINYMLTGVHSTDYSDAAGTLLLDVERKSWSRELLSLCGICEAQLPMLFESDAITGTLCPAAVESLGLPKTVRVAAGAGDNAAAAIGTGTVGNGACTVSLGTSGTIFIASETFCMDPCNAIHTFAHADGGYCFLACMLSAASCNEWFCNTILNTADYSGQQAEIAREALGKNTVYFLPYLTGERSPINDTDARGVFIGMANTTTRADLVQAVLEGVAFALRDSFEVIKGLGVQIHRAKICGGGSKSPLWRDLLANILGIPLDM